MVNVLLGSRKEGALNYWAESLLLVEGNGKGGVCTFFVGEKKRFVLNGFCPKPVIETEERNGGD